MQVSGTFPALSDGVGSKKKPTKKKKHGSAKAILDLLSARVKGAK